LALIASFAFFLLVMFPNIPLGLEQAKRTFIGYDALAETGGPLLESYADEIERSGEPADWYVDEHIPYAPDFEVWGNLDYWETPEEVIKAGRSDCEGKAILTKAAIGLINRREMQENRTSVPVVSKIIPQQQHVYVEVKKEENRTGTLVNTTVAYYKMPEEPHESFFESVLKGLDEFCREVPEERQILLVAGYVGIWAHLLSMRIRRIYREERKKSVSRGLQ